MITPLLEKITYQNIELKKRHPLKISREISYGSINLWVQITGGGCTGIGECAPSEQTDSATAQDCQRQLNTFFDHNSLQDHCVVTAWQAARDIDIAPCAWAAIDIAWWDWMAKVAKLPLFYLLGLQRQSVPTSVTLGIVNPEVVRDRIDDIINRTGTKFIKVKLGSPDGIDADKSMFSAVIEATKNTNVGIRVDANGGWDLAGAKKMMKWLDDRGVEYVEQPLSEYSDEQLPELFKNRALPIYVDESCNFKSDVVRLSDCVDGVNLKLMKCGGITEALRIVATARAHGLKTMIGCMGESSISISAGAAIGSLFDYIDLDSHFNLSPDPSIGALLEDGVVLPPLIPGHGAFAISISEEI